MTRGGAPTTVPVMSQGKQDKQAKQDGGKRTYAPFDSPIEAPKAEPGLYLVATPNQFPPLTRILNRLLRA